jgi:HEAT repeat protein
MIAISALALLATVARSDEPDLKALFGQLFPEMSQEQAQQKWQEACWNAAAPGHEAQRSLACTLMVEKLGPEAPTPARVWLLKQLERIGRDESVSAIAPVIADKEPLVRDAAIRALANNPAPAAGARLRDALGAAKETSTKVALLNALGFRAEAESVEVLGKAVRSGQEALVVAAAKALARIPTKEVVSQLMDAMGSAPPNTRLQMGDAILRLGNRMLAEGKVNEAQTVATPFFVHFKDESLGLAGLELTLKTTGDEAPAIIRGALEHGSPAARQVALGFVSNLDSKAIKTLADALPKLSAPRQAGLLLALGTRRDRAALPAVVSAAASADPSVRSAALTALGGVGDGSTVPLLIKAIQEGGDQAAAARQSLETVFADGVDQALIETLKKTDDRGRQALYIEILDHRRAVAAVPVLLEQVASDELNVRRRAIAALGNVASPEDVGGMIKGLLAIKDAGERDEAGRALAAVCARTAEEDRQAEPVLAAYRQATPADQLVLVPVLGRIGGAEALALVRETVASADKARRASGRQALFNWPDSAVATDLAKLAETADDQDSKTRAIQELARVAVLTGPLSDDDRLALLVRGFTVAGTNQQKRLILDRAREIHSFAAVKFAADHMREPGLASQAIATVVDLLHRDEIRQPNQAAANTILDQVIALSKDKSLVERAKTFKSTK